MQSSAPGEAFCWVVSTILCDFENFYDLRSVQEAKKNTSWPAGRPAADQCCQPRDFRGGDGGGESRSAHLERETK